MTYGKVQYKLERKTHFLPMNYKHIGQGRSANSTCPKSLYDFYIFSNFYLSSCRTRYRAEPISGGWRVANSRQWRQCGLCSFSISGLKFILRINFKLLSLNFRTVRQPAAVKLSKYYPTKSVLYQQLSLCKMNK